MSSTNRGAERAQLSLQPGAPADPGPAAWGSAEWLNTQMMRGQKELREQRDAAEGRLRAYACGCAYGRTPDPDCEARAMDAAAVSRVLCSPPPEYPCAAEARAA